MKTRRIAFTLAGTALLLLGIYIIAKWQVNLASHGAGNEVWELQAVDIKRITIRQPGENGDYLIFETTGQGSWVLSSPEIPYDHALVEGLPLSLVNIAAEKKIAVNNSTLSEYGLDTPVDVRIFTEDGTEHKLLLGGETSSGTSRYFSLDDGAIYTMGFAKAQAIVLDSLNVRDKNVLKLNRTLRPRDIASKITHIRFFKGNTLVQEAERNNEGSWQHNGNPLTNENAETAAAISEAMACVIVNEFIGEGNLENYQLYTPQYTIEFENENGIQTLLLGSVTSEGNLLYARISGSNDVFTVSRQGFTFLK